MPERLFIDADELAVRIAECCLGMKRPKGVTAAEALRHLGDEEVVAGFHRAATAAARYVAECISGKSGSNEIEIHELVVGKGSRQ